MKKIEYQSLENRLARIENLLARVIDSRVSPSGELPDPKYYARRVLEVGTAQAKKEMRAGGLIA